MGIMRAPIMGDAYNITINFDSNITQVKSDVDGTWDTSGTIKTVANASHTFTVTLKDGHIIDTVTTDSGTLNNITNNTFDVVVGLETTITITSKLATTRKSVDLTTLSGWANLSDGEHTIQIVAKGTGYRDSEKSSAVTFTKGTATSGETWVLNEAIDLKTLESVVGTGLSISNVSYYPLTSVNSTGDGIYNELTKGTFTIDADSIDAYGGYVSYNFGNASQYRVYCNNDSWGAYVNEEDLIMQEEKLRTLIFQTAPTGNLLTWLQANGTKQGNVNSGGNIQ